MNNLTTRIYQKMTFLAFMLGFSNFASASNFTALPATLSIYLGLPSLIVVGLILFILSRLDLTQFAKIIGFIFLVIAVLINAPLVYLDSVNVYQIATTIATTGECFYETELRLCQGILWFYGFYTLLLLAFFYCVYRFIKQCFPPTLPLLKDTTDLP